MENNKVQGRIVALKAKIYKETSNLKDGLLNTISPNLFLSPVVDAIAKDIYDLSKCENTKHLIFGQTYRQSKLLFKEVEKFIAEGEAEIEHSSDQYVIRFKNGSSIYALPMTDRICGHRFNILIFAE